MENEVIRRYWMYDFIANLQEAILYQNVLVTQLCKSFSRLILFNNNLKLYQRIWNIHLYILHIKYLSSIYWIIKTALRTAKGAKVIIYSYCRAVPNRLNCLIIKILPIIINHSTEWQNVERYIYIFVSQKFPVPSMLIEPLSFWLKKL